MDPPILSRSSRRTFPTLSSSAPNYTSATIGTPSPDAFDAILVLLLTETEGIQLGVSTHDNRGRLIGDLDLWQQRGARAFHVVIHRRPSSAPPTPSPSSYDKDVPNANEVERSMLGLQSYWDATYVEDLANFNEHGYAGEVW